MCDFGALRTDRKGLELVIRWFLSTWSTGDSCSSSPRTGPGKRRGCDLKESRDKQEREKQMQSVWKGCGGGRKEFCFYKCVWEWRPLELCSTQPAWLTHRSSD